MILKQNLDIKFLVLYWNNCIVFFSIFLSKYRELTEVPLCLVPGYTSSATATQDSLNMAVQHVNHDFLRA